MTRPIQLAPEQLASAALVGMVVVVVAFASGLGIQYGQALAPVLAAREPEVAASPPGDRVLPTPSGPGPINYIGVAQPVDAAPTSAPEQPTVATRTAMPTPTRQAKATPVKAKPIGTPPAPVCPPPLSGVLELPSALVSDLLDGLVPAAQSTVSGVLGRTAGLGGLLGSLLHSPTRAAVAPTTALSTLGVPGVTAACSPVQP